MGTGTERRRRGMHATQRAGPAGCRVSLTGKRSAEFLKGEGGQGPSVGRQGQVRVLRSPVQRRGGRTREHPARGREARAPATP